MLLRQTDANAVHPNCELRAEHVDHAGEPKALRADDAEPRQRVAERLAQRLVRRLRATATPSGQRRQHPRHNTIARQAAPVREDRERTCSSRGAAQAPSDAAAATASASVIGWDISVVQWGPSYNYTNTGRTRPVLECDPALPSVTLTEWPNTPASLVLVVRLVVTSGGGVALSYGISEGGVALVGAAARRRCNATMKPW